MYKLTLDFLGKDSVPFKSTIEVPDEVGKALESLIKDKGKKEKIFDKATSGTVNNFLAECLPYCTAKLFRTAYGTKLLAEELQKSDVKKSMADYEKKAIYDNACLAVSTKLNHQKNVAKTFDSQIEKVDERIEQAKENLEKRREAAKEKLKRIRKEIDIAKKCFEGEKLTKKMKSLKARKDKIQIQVEKAEERVKKLELNKDLKKATKTISLATARTAYSSPKIVYSFCKDLDLDIKFVYNKALQEKYKWAENTSASYWKNYPAGGK